jgi:large subunit ribosomal protein L13
MQKTSTVKKQEVKRDWFIINAKSVRLGKLAGEAAKLLQGKNRPEYSYNVDCGNNVIIINTKLLDIHPKKLENKLYRRHSGYPGGFKELTLDQMMKRSSNEVVRKAVWGMLPKTKLGRKIIKRLHLAEDEKHKFEAQKPVKKEVK